MNNSEYIEKVVERIKKNADPDKIILFGSYARGNPTKDSDIDFFILMESDEKPVFRRIKISKLFLDREYPLDFIVYNKRELDEKMKEKDDFIEEIINNGKVLYEKNS